MSDVLHLQTGVQAIRGGVLATLLAFAATEAARLVMLVARATRSTDALWPVLSSIQQAGWQLLLACYGVLIAGSALLLRSSGGSAAFRWGMRAIVCLAVALASRVSLIVALTNVTDSDLWGLIMAAMTLLESWSLLAFLWMVDGLIGEFAAATGDTALKLAARSHAVFTGCLGVAILFVPFIRRGQDLASAGARLEALLSLACGGICLAWTYRLASDANRQLASLRSEHADEVETPSPQGSQ